MKLSNFSIGSKDHQPILFLGNDECGYFIGTSLDVSCDEYINLSKMGVVNHEIDLTMGNCPENVVFQICRKYHKDFFLAKDSKWRG